MTRHGGATGIEISPPHYYSGMLEWSRALGGIPILLHADDREWVTRRDPLVEHWSGETYEPPGGVTLLRLDGHFAGGTVLHWPAGAEGRGTLLSGDIVHVLSHRRSVSFMWSYPNVLPLPASEIRRIVGTLEEWEFDRIRGAWRGLVIRAGANDVVRVFAEHYLRARELVNRRARRDSPPPNATGARIRDHIGRSISARDPRRSGSQTLPFRACHPSRRPVRMPLERAGIGAGSRQSSRSVGPREVAVIGAAEGPDASRLRIVLGVRDERLTRAITERLEHEDRLELVGVASTSREVADLADRERPDVVLLDEVLATQEEAHIERLRGTPGASLIVLVEPNATRRERFPAGATAYLAMRPVDDLIEGLLDVATIAAGLLTQHGLRTQTD